VVRVLFTPEALAQLRGLPRPINARMDALVVRLESWPAVSGVKALAGKLAGHYRVRTGDYRMQFTLQAVRNESTMTKTVKGKKKVETVVTLDYVIRIEKVGHRDGFYGE
jgi:mRNA-degrading endonuclease RelE of RelBE toxin-antitoxin system